MKTIKECNPLFSPEDSDLSKVKWRSNNGYPVLNPSKGSKRYAHHTVLERILGRPRLPSELTDHINGNRMDVRRENLRVTNFIGNAQNRPSSQWKGTTWHKGAEKWQATIQSAGRCMYLGLFNDRNEAVQVAANKRKELGFLTGNTSSP